MKNLTEEIQVVWDDNKNNFEKKLSDWLSTIKAGNEKIIDAKTKFNQWGQLMVYTSISKIKSGTFSLRFQGQEVGEIILRNDCVILRVGNQKHFEGPFENGDEFEWRKEKGKLFRKHYKDLEICKLKLRSPEHRIESKFIKEMLKGTGKFGLNNLRLNPVTIGSKKGSKGIPLQFPLPISAHRGVPKAARGGHSGHIDILSRHDTGSGTKTKLCIWELKQPEKYDNAASQAYIYAYTLLKVLRESNHGSEWYNVYGIHSAIPEKIEIEAVVAITLDQKDKFEKERKTLEENASFDIDGDLIKLYPAYYEEEPDCIILKSNPFEA